MKNADMPAMPQAATENGYGCNYGNKEGQVAQGLTKREKFAMNPIAAYRSQPEVMEAKPKKVAGWAIEDANALLKELEK